MSQVLIVDDQPGDLLWLLDLLDARGYGHVLATNGKEARTRLAGVKAGTEAYALAIIDVGVAILPIEDLILQNLDDEEFFRDSRDTGIHLCRYARKELGLSSRDLLIACLTVRDDDVVKDAMEELGIQLFNRAPHSSESIRGFIEENLKPLA